MKVRVRDLTDEQRDLIRNVNCLDFEGGDHPCAGCPLRCNGKCISIHMDKNPDFLVNLDKVRRLNEVDS